MSRSTRWLATAAAVALLCSVGATIGGQTAGAAVRARTSQQVTLTVWDQFTGPETTAVDKLYHNFTAAHPTITIRREAVQTDQMRQTVKTALASGTGPDIIFYDAGPGYAGVLANAGLLRPLDAYAATYNWNARVIPSAREGVMINGKVYGLPLQVDLIGVYYNKTLIDKAKLTVPRTVDQLISFCGQAKAKGYIPMAFSDKPGWQAFHEFSMLSNNIVGPEAMRQLLLHNKGNWNTPQMTKAIQLFFVDMQKAGCFPPHVNALGYDDANSLFYTGKALLNPTGSWLSTNIDQNVKNYQIGMMPFPAVSGGKGSFWDTGVGSAYYISSKSQHPKEAAQFLDYLISQQAVKVWVEQTGSFPPVKFDTRAAHVSPLFRSILNVLQSGINGKTQFGYNIDVLAPAPFNTAMQNGFQAILAGSESAQQETSQLQTAWQQGKKG